MEAFLVSISTVALAEMGDRTQLLSLLLLATRLRQPWPILAGVLVATLANHALAGVIGAWFGHLLTPSLLNRRDQHDRHGLVDAEARHPERNQGQRDATRRLPHHFGRHSSLRKSVIKRRSPPLRLPPVKAISSRLSPAPHAACSRPTRQSSFWETSLQIASLSERSAMRPPC